jgi:SH3 domain protein
VNVYAVSATAPTAVLPVVLALAFALTADGASAAAAYVSDELVLNVYSQINQQGERLATLHSGAAVDTLGSSGEFTQVRLTDGTSGWVKSSYLTAQEPATVRVKRLEEELARTKATTPALAEAAARSEVDRLQREVVAKQAELDAERNQPTTPIMAGSARQSSGLMGAGTVACATLAAAILGFWLGYVTLARRVRQKFGGLRVY